MDECFWDRITYLGGTVLEYIGLKSSTVDLYLFQGESEKRKLQIL